MEKGEGGRGIRVLRSRSSCQIVCNISTPLVSSTQLDRFSRILCACLLAVLKQ